ncbi:MFS transporter [Yersinia mollaretii]|uniref:Membrane transport protein n=1 Tax=Yersinia mollaretii TaxID=33060 RepID=A0AA36LI31_YERMO|nr:MFS transporter [Yersinia mollaretii]MDA5526949.1 MFS transporter [Yersinia mollaretii]MDR7872344.1 MFS transporter [Yersinia mollaretii]PHZ31791.1 MFS transporter [Yersinia mollaretii]WQC73145.1 MFS transporter [Yersinia mollaretii]CNE60923.1 putative membrane transport protein [Yersinia mollaretii]
MKSDTNSIDISVADKTTLRKVIISLSLPILLSSLATSIANVGLPTLTQAFNASFQAAQWVVLAYLLAITTSAITIGRMGDIINKRLLLKAGIALFTLASLGCALAPSIELLIVARVFQGLGAAAMMTLTLALVGETISKGKTGRAMGMLGTLSAIGTALGPSLGGMLIAGFGWPAMFLITLPFGLLAWLLVSRYLPPPAAPLPPPPKPITGFDPLGMLLLGLTLALYALSMTLGHGAFTLLNFALLVGAAIGVGLFGWAESRAAYPLIQIAILRQPVLRGGLITSALVTTVMMATLVVGPFYLSQALNLPAEWVGFAMSGGPVIAALCGVPAGYLVDRFGAKGMVIVGLSALTLGAMVLTMVSPTAGIVGYVAPVCLMTAGYAIFQAANNTGMISAVGADQRGVVSGMLNLARNLGLMTGASVMGAIFAFASTSRDIQWATASQISEGMRLTYAVAALLGIMGLWVAVKYSKNKSNQ